MMKARLYILACGLVSVLSLAAQSPARLEYFFDTDPGYGKATPVSSVSEGNNTLTFDPGNLTVGAHVLYVRSMDDQGHWSPLVSRPVFVEPQEVTVARLEYFLDDNDPGRGQATAVALPSNLKEAIAFEVSTEGLTQGNHKVNVRAQASTGQWTELMTATFEVVQPSGVIGIEGNASETDVYDLRGRKVRIGVTTLGGLPQGVYVVRGKKVVVK